ncbi:MAG: DUF4416 family protein [Oscillospiraceae bacterium]|nr:DUF4416 family protein [Oscillospiraceae bacterium]
MGTTAGFEPEKLICAVLYTDEATANDAITKLKAAYGETDLESERYCFSEISPYYDSEMGGTVFRRLLSFRDCRNPAELAAIKTFTNQLEQAAAADGQRRVNLDPGFVSCGRLSLATTKNAGHRIPLSDGIYAELTLFYARHAWNPFPWTYMDFKLPQVHAFLTQARKIYMEQRKNWLSSDCRS